MCNSNHTNMSKSLKKKNFYEVLGVQKNCNSNDIKTSFIRLSKKYHPDKNKDAKESHEKFIILNEAYMTLINPLKRQKYDQFLSEKTLFDFNKILRNEDINSSRTKHTNNFGKGFRNMKAVFPKGFVITAFVVLFFAGGGLQWFTIRSNSRSKREILDKKSRMASLILELSRREAKIRGNNEQIRRFANGSLNKFTIQELMEEYEKSKSSKSKS